MSTCATSTHERGCWGAACGIRTDDDDDDPYVECELTPASLGGKLHALMYTPEQVAAFDARPAVYRQIKSSYLLVMGDDGIRLHLHHEHVSQ